MRKKLKYINIFIFVAFIFCIIPCCKVCAAYATYNEYNSEYDYQYSCTYIAWTTVSSELGIVLPDNWGNAGNWYTNAAKDGYRTYSVGSVIPKAGWLVVWAGPMGSPGHVAYIKSVDEATGKIVIHEGGSSWPGNDHGVYERYVSYTSDTATQYWNRNCYTISMIGFINPIKNYNVSYNSNGGTGTMSDSNDVEFGEDFTIPQNTFKRTGYTFVGWNTVADGSGISYSDNAVVQGGFGESTTLFAQWKGISYTIIFKDSDGKKELGKQKMIYGESKALKKFKKDGYYVTWKASNGKTYSDGQSISNLVSKKDGTITLTANWKVSLYTISFDGNGATKGTTSSIALRYDEEKKLTLNGFEKKGYSFVNWKNLKTGKTYKNGETVKNLSKVHKENVVLTAQWEKVKYSITYKLNGGKNNKKNPEKYYVTSAFNFANPTRTGYSFAGWYSDAKFKHKVTQITKGTIGNKTLYAKWEIRYKITYNLNGGSNNANNPTYYVKNSTTINLKSPTKTGYTFLGWYKDKKFKQKISKIPKGTVGNITLYAKWKINKYSITFCGNGATSGVMNQLSCEYNKKYTLSTNLFVREGYSFIGWNTNPDGSGEQYSNNATVKNITAGNNVNVNLYAQWLKETYSITYNLNGGVNNSENPNVYSIYQTVSLKNPSYTGYTFAGWYTDSSCTNQISQIIAGTTGDITLYAKWTANKYTIIFDGNGATSGTMMQLDCEYNASYTLPTNNFVRTNYTFAGWNTHPDGSGISYNDGENISNISSDNNVCVTLYAQWNKITNNNYESLFEAFENISNEEILGLPISYWNYTTMRDYILTNGVLSEVDSEYYWYQLNEGGFWGAIDRTLKLSSIENSSQIESDCFEICVDESEINTLRIYLIRPKAVNASFCSSFDIENSKENFLDLYYKIKDVDCDEAIIYKQDSSAYISIGICLREDEDYNVDMYYHSSKTSISLHFRKEAESPLELFKVYIIQKK